MTSCRANTFILSLIIMLASILFLGCIDSTAPTDHNKPDSIRLSNITSAFKELPEVQQFLKVHPNASINISYFEGDELKNSSQSLYPAALLRLGVPSQRLTQGF